MKSLATFPRWLARHRGVSLLMLLLLVLAIRLVWAWYVSRELERALAQIRAAGEPASLAELKYLDVPDVENAWLLQLKAGQGLTMDSPRNSNLDYTDPPYSSDWVKLAAASEAAHVRSFALAAKARELRGVQFRKSGVGVWNMPYLYSCKQLANTLADGAEYAHYRHDELLALDRLLDVMHLARSLRQDDFLVSQLVAAGIEALECHSAQIIGRDLAVDPKVRDSEEIKGKMRRLINELLDERLAFDGWRRCMMVERLVVLEEVRRRADSTWFLRPLANRQETRTLEAFEVIIESTRATNFPQVAQMFSGLDRLGEEKQPVVLYGPAKFAEHVPRYSRWFLEDWFYSSAASERQFRILAERRVTATALACALYRAEQGKWPATLADLVPKYLPAVPVDPLRSDGHAVGYAIVQAAGVADRPVIYFDPGGGDLGVPATQMSGWTARQTGRPPRPARQYRDVGPYPPAASPKAVDDKPEKSDAPGKNSKEHN